MTAIFQGFIAAVLTILFLGQTSVAPSFEVASVKPAGDFSLERMQSGQMHVANIRGNRATFTFVSLPDLVAYAYRVKSYQVAGPEWMRDGRWNIAATLPEGATADQVPDMIRALLIERFKLVAHREPREHPVFELLVDKGGLQVKEAPAEDPSTAPPATRGSSAGPGLFLGGFVNGSMRVSTSDAVITGGSNSTTRVSQGPTGGMRMEMSRITMAAFADMLTPFVERPVIDRTGLTAAYQVTLDLPFEAMTRVIQSQAGNASMPVGFGVGGGGFGNWPGNGAGVSPGLPGATPDSTSSSMTDAVRRLGLKLQPGNAPVETVVIDRLDKTPTDD